MAYKDFTTDYNLLVQQLTMWIITIIHLKKFVSFVNKTSNETSI